MITTVLQETMVILSSFGWLSDALLDFAKVIQIFGIMFAIYIMHGIDDADDLAIASGVSMAFGSVFCGCAVIISILTTFSWTAIWGTIVGAIKIVAAPFVLFLVCRLVSFLSLLWRKLTIKEPDKGDSVPEDKCIRCCKKAPTYIRSKLAESKTDDTRAEVVSAMEELKDVIQRTPFGEAYEVLCNEFRALPDNALDQALAERMRDYYLPPIKNLASSYEDMSDPAKEEIAHELRKMMDTLRGILHKEFHDPEEFRIAALKAEVTAAQNLARMRGDVTEHTLELRHHKTEM